MRAARELGLAARERYQHRLTKQYPLKETGTALYPLIVGEGGRWHEVTEQVFRGLAKDAVQGQELSTYPAGVILRRRMTRLSALLLRGVAAICKEGLPSEKQAQESTSAFSRILQPDMEYKVEGDMSFVDIHRLWWPLE